MKASPTFGSTVPIRTGKQVRERYHNYLENDFNFDPISGAEAFIIFELQKVHGKKWAKICREMGGRRSENMVKNFFYTIKRIFFQQAEIMVDMHQAALRPIIRRYLSA